MSHTDKWLHTDRGYSDDASPHSDWSDSYIDVHENWSDHNDLAHIDDPPDDHENWSDSYNDWADHTDTAHVDLYPHNDTHSDYTDHGDLPYSDQTAYSDSPHLDWFGHNDSSHADNPRFLGYDPTYKDWSDHNDLVEPHGDWNDHTDQTIPMDIRDFAFSRTWSEEEYPYPFKEILPAGTLYPSSSLYPTFRPDLRITWVAWGNGSSAVSGHLGNELGRVPISLISQRVDEIYTEAYIGPYDANTTITEIGWFGGDSASEAKDSGVMLAREPFSFTKTISQALLLTRTDTRGW